MLPGLRTADGQLYVTTALPTSDSVMVGGVGVTNAGQVHVSTALPVQVFANGLGVRTSGGILCIRYGFDLTNAHWQEGLPFDFSGHLCCQLNQTPAPTDPYVGGVRVGPLGGVYVTDQPITVPTAFSDGFDTGYQ